jgi:hypothetical protein
MDIFASGQVTMNYAASCPFSLIDVRLFPNELWCLPLVRYSPICDSQRSRSTTPSLRWILDTFQYYPRGIFLSGNAVGKGAVLVGSLQREELFIIYSYVPPWILLCGYFALLWHRLDYRWYGPDVSKSPILPLAAAVTALALGASPAQAATLSPGKRDAVKVVAFPLLALKGQAPASVGSHVSHSSHVSGTGGHNSHVSHVSHVSSVPGPPPAPTSAAPVASPPAPPPAAITTSPAPAGSSTAVSPTVAPQGSLTGSPAGSPAVVGSGSPTSSTGNGGGCAFFVVAPFSALASGIRRLARWVRAR